MKQTIRVYPFPVMLWKWMPDTSPCLPVHFNLQRIRLQWCCVIVWFDWSNSNLSSLTVDTRKIQIGYEHVWRQSQSTFRPESFRLAIRASHPHLVFGAAKRKTSTTSTTAQRQQELRRNYNRFFWKWDVRHCASLQRFDVRKTNQFKTEPKSQRSNN